MGDTRAFDVLKDGGLELFKFRWLLEGFQFKLSLDTPRPDHRFSIRQLHCAAKFNENTVFIVLGGAKGLAGRS